MMIGCFVRLLLICNLLLADSFVLPPTGPQKIQVSPDGFSVKMCVQKGQLSKFCYRGNPTKDQTNGCDPGFCGLRSSLTTNLTDETIVEFGEAGTSTCEKCAIFLISPSEQEIQIERTIRSRGTCNWQRELNGALEIYAESNSSSAIEVIGAEMFVDKKEEEEKPKTWIAAPIVISVLVVVGLLILGIWCWKCKKDQKKDADVQKKPDTEKGLAAPRKIEENAEEKKMAYVSNSNEPVQVENEEGRSTKASWMKREKKCSRHNEQGCCQAKAEQEETAKKEAKEGKRAKEKPAAKKCLLDEAQQKSPSPSLSRILIGISEQFTKIAGKNKDLDNTSMDCKCCRILVNILVKDVINTLVYTAADF